VNDPSDIIHTFQQAEAALRASPALSAVLEGGESPEAVAHKLAALLDTTTRESLTRLALVLDAATDQAAPPTVTHPNGRTVLNPLAEAALIERASLDGDVPEYRLGPLPEGATPAVPVKTTSRNLIQVGLMLERASREVAQEYRAALAQHAAQAALLLNQAEREGQNIALIRRGLEALVPTGVEGYRAGAVPALRGVLPPTMRELALLSPGEERRMVWKAISTTQGRRSLVPVIEQALGERYPDLTFEAGDASCPPLVEWTLWSNGADDLDTRFSPVESALERFALALAALSGKPCRAKVQPVNNPSARVFGWALYVWE
jgi:hypothetical protein